ncbi:hypothetical protein J6590_095600 [Homalodisca vitripennis]|nr:hypothetical protein J6590_005661 [Homalodisca vitripennis]KAG8294769.1 hypothetical protein J6590_095600 [Homalodisca vitripennis]
MWGSLYVSKGNIVRKRYDFSVKGTFNKSFMKIMKRVADKTDPCEAKRKRKEQHHGWVVGQQWSTKIR